MATTVGVPAKAMHYLLMAMTALTLVAAFRTVGSILVIGLLVIPAAAASLLTRRLDRLIGLSLLFAAAAAPLGHVLAKTLPQPIFSRLGFSEVYDVSTSGMMAVAAGLLFGLAVLCAPERGVLARLWHRWKLALRIASDDVLGTLFRREESGGTRVVEEPSLSWGWRWLAELQLCRLGHVVHSPAGLSLTSSGREAARKVVQAHRLWEAYLQKHFDLPADHLHAPAHWVEHFLDDELRERLLTELDDPANDPHGREIPK
jgi:manganese/zinc/iron transport system permease protein